MTEKDPAHKEMDKHYAARTAARRKCFTKIDTHHIKIGALEPGPTKIRGEKGKWIPAWIFVTEQEIQKAIEMERK